MRIGLIGPSSAGKTSLFLTLQEALARGRHGYPRALKPQLRVAAEDRPVLGLTAAEVFEQIVVDGSHSNSDTETSSAINGEIEATPPDKVVSKFFALTLEGSQPQLRRTIKITITDAAGEHSFGLKMKNPAFKDYRDKLFNELGQCSGIIVVVTFSQATNPDFVLQLANWLLALTHLAERSASDMPANHERRVVIALTRYDALFTDFGSDALRLAANPEIAKDAIVNLIGDTSHTENYKSEIAKFNHTAGGRFRIAFVPTSSYGFVPGFGCVNLDPDVSSDDVSYAIKAGKSPEAFEASLPNYAGQRLFPFLTADPFIFAATGDPNPFVVPLEVALGEQPHGAAESRGEPAFSNVKQEPEQKPQPKKGSDAPRRDGSKKDWYSSLLDRFTLDL